MGILHDWQTYLDLAEVDVSDTVPTNPAGVFKALIMQAVRGALQLLRQAIRSDQSEARTQSGHARLFQTALTHGMCEVSAFSVQFNIRGHFSMIWSET